MTPDDDDLVRGRQRSVRGSWRWLLGAFVVLVFAITIAKMLVNR